MMRTATEATSRRLVPSCQLPAQAHLRARHRSLLELPANQRDGLGPLTFDAKTNRITTAGFAYDAAGNQIRTVRADGRGQQYRYDAAGRLAQVLDENGKPVESYDYYNATNMRLSTHVGDPANLPKVYVWNGNTVIAEYQQTANCGHTVAVDQELCLRWRSLALHAVPDASGTTELVQYHHPDRISTRLITTANSNDVVRLETMPYGTLAPGASAGSTSRYFTTYDRSPAADMDYAVNRYFAAAQGRFTQVDPLGMGRRHGSNPQSLNMYNYVTSDPVKRDSTLQDNGKGAPMQSHQNQSYHQTALLLHHRCLSLETDRFVLCFETGGWVDLSGVFRLGRSWAADTGGLGRPRGRQFWRCWIRKSTGGGHRISAAQIDLRTPDSKQRKVVSRTYLCYQRSPGWGRFQKRN